VGELEDPSGSGPEAIIAGSKPAAPAQHKPGGQDPAIDRLIRLFYPRRRQSRSAGQILAAVLRLFGEQLAFEEHPGRRDRRLRYVPKWAWDFSETKYGFESESCYANCSTLG